MAPPRQKQFVYQTKARQALRPGEKVYYRNGRYVIGPARTPPPVARAAAKPLTMDVLLSKLGTGFLSPTQQRLEAQKIASQTMAGSASALQAAQDRAEAEALAAAAATTGFGQAASQLAGGNAEAIKQAYLQASQQTGALGTALTGEARAAQEAAAAESTAALQRVGNVGPAITAAPSGANVAGYIGSVLPGSELAAAGAFGYNRALGESQDIRSRFADLAALTRYKGQVETQQDLFSRLAELQAKRPEVVREALRTVSGENRENIATVLAALQLQQQGRIAGTEAAISRQNIASDEAIAAANRKADAAAAKAATAADAEEARIKSLADQGFAPDGVTVLPGFYLGPAGRPAAIPSGMMLNAAGKLVPIPSRGGTRGAAGAPKQTDWVDARETMFNRMYDRLGFDRKANRYRAKDWRGFGKDDIARYVMKHVGQDFIASYGNKARVQKMANDVAATIHTQLLAARKRRGGGQSSGGAKKALGI